MEWNRVYCILFVENEKERDRDHIAHFRKFQYDDENHGTIQPHRGLCGMVSHFQISESYGLWFQGTCVCLFVITIVVVSVLFVTISSYYLERRIRKVMVVLTPWLVKMVVVIAAIIILIRVC